MVWPADLIPAAMIGVGFVVLIALVEVWTRWAHPNPEWPRKIVHVVGGAICLSFPFLLQSPWTVLLLGISLFLLILAGKRFRFLHSLHGIERESKGAEYYPLMIFVLFCLSHNTPWLYAASLLALAVADALAALIGSRYGRLRFQVDQEWKTVEGSLAFFMAAWVSIAIPLLISKDSDLPGFTHRILIAGVVAILVTMLEAISRHGRDNIWIPLGTLLILSRLIDEPVGEVITQLISIVIVCLILAISVGISRSMNVGATLTLILAIYSGWALTSFDFALPFISGTLLCMVVAYFFPPNEPLRSAAVLHMVLPIVLAAAMADVCELLGYHSLYQVLFAAYLGGCLVIATQNVGEGLLKSRQQYRSTELIQNIIVSAIVSSILIFPLWYRRIGISFSWPVFMFTLSMTICVIHKQLFGGAAPSDQKGSIVLRRYLAITAAMGISAAMYHFELLPHLTPR